MTYTLENPPTNWQQTYYINKVDGKSSILSQIYDPDEVDINYFPCYDTQLEAQAALNSELINKLKEEISISDVLHTPYKREDLEELK